MKLKAGLITVLAALMLALLPLSTFGVSEAHAAGPCKVTGYSNHAKLMVSQRDISKAEEVQSVKQYCSAGKKQSNGNWLYKSTDAFLPTVVLSSNGTVVTTYWEGSGGGGGGGGGGGFIVRSADTSGNTAELN